MSIEIKPNSNPADESHYNSEIENTEITDTDTEETLTDDQLRKQMRPDHKPSVFEKLDTRGKKFTAALAGVALLLGAGVAGSKVAETLGEQSEDDKTVTEAPITPGQIQTSTPSAEAVPSVSPANTAPLETATPTPAATAETTRPTAAEFSVNELGAMPSEKFNGLSFEDKAPYLKSLLSDAENNLMYYTAPGTNLYKYNPLEVAKETNTPQEVVMQVWFGLQLTHAQPKSNDIADHTLDTEKASKAMSVPFYSTESVITPTYSFVKKQIDGGAEAGIIKDRYTDAKEVSPITEEEDHEGNKIKVRTISFLDNGEEHIMKFTLRKLDDESSIWQIYKEVV